MKFSIILCCLTFLLACQYQTTKKPIQLIEKEKMSRVLEDVLLMESYYQSKHGIPGLYKNALDSTNKALEFLGLSELPELNNEVQNEAKDFTSLGLHQKFKSAKNWEKNLIRLLIPSKKIRERFLNKIYQANIKKTVKKTMSTELRNKLTQFFVEDIKATEKLIDRNLNHWMK